MLGLSCSLSDREFSEGSSKMPNKPVCVIHQRPLVSFCPACLGSRKSAKKAESSRRNGILGGVSVKKKLKRSEKHHFIWADLDTCKCGDREKSTVHFKGSNKQNQIGRAHV